MKYIADVAVGLTDGTWQSIPVELDYSPTEADFENRAEEEALGQLKGCADILFAVCLGWTTAPTTTPSTT